MWVISPIIWDIREIGDDLSHSLGPFSLTNGSFSVHPNEVALLLVRINGLFHEEYRGDKTCFFLEKVEEQGAKLEQRSFIYR
jgi:hypothetical protein